ncbi:MAG: hypothetical protein U9N39_06240 [Campylobacterota bacterium]|nr:hypothetical protein [Campylobacterota bacterium]
MKTFLITLLFILLFDACSTKNAFSTLGITQEQQISEENRQSSKIKNEETIDGLVSLFYLNALEPESVQKSDSFYIYLYTKSDNSNVKFLLNDKEPIKIEELKEENRFSHLNKFQADWSKYYHVTFEKEDENLSFQIKNGEFSSDILLFNANEL